MRKLLFFLVMVSAISISLIGITQAIADTNLTATVNPTPININITPKTIEFGPLTPCTTNNSALNGPIIINASGQNNNVDISISITEVIGDFFDKLMCNGKPAIGTSFILHCIGTETCDYEIGICGPTIDVQCGSKAGKKNGAIVYTVTVV